jgi:hypothetical protein
MSKLMARAEAPGPAVIGPLAVVALQRLSSQTNSTGNA